MLIVGGGCLGPRVVLPELGQPAAVIAIFKADKIEHVRENCGASGLKLSAEHFQLLETQIRRNSRSRPERFLRRLARRALQYSGRNLGNATAMDCDRNNGEDQDR